MSLSGTGLRALSRVPTFTKWINRRDWANGLCKQATARRFPVRSRRITTASTPTSQNRKPYYVTTPIFYVNAEPHVGHLYTIVLADILKRWQVLLGNTDAKLLTGTDEHGIKVQQAAEKRGLTPRTLCDETCRTFQNLAREANVKYDHFIRTTDSMHIDTVRYLWDMLDKAGYIYVSKHEGWYCVSEETFYPKSGVHAALDPATGRKIMTTIETGKEVEWSSETNYHFKLSEFRDRLLEFYRNNPTFIRPERYMKEVIQEVEAGLQDLSISRPVSRVKWGIPVPGDETQTIYVWLDALVNYLTYAGYPCVPGQEDKSIWPANVHVIGKDIVRFHCIYWPAFLMALNLPPPRQVLTHAHWTINHEKMSKSTGNVVNPHFAIERFGVDTMRFYLAIEGNLKNDCNYDNSFIVQRYTKELQWGLGNLTSRLVRGKKWNVRQSIVWASEGKMLDPSTLDKDHQTLLESVRQEVEEHMRDLDPRKAVSCVMDLVHATNKYFHASEPWTLATQHDANEPSPVTRVVFNTAESLRIAGILLQPFMPTKSAQLLDMLGVAQEPGKRNFDAAAPGFDFEYGVPLVELKKGREGTLFPPLLAED
ncbi:hypothetical protein VTO42DRAFT_3844 [Malbranchea cinnamomea]